MRTPTKAVPSGLNDSGRACLVLSVTLALVSCAGGEPDPGAVRLDCDAGDAESCRTLAYWHETGFFGVTQDPRLAFDLYERSCDGGDAAGCLTLGTIHRSGEVVPQDLALAADLFDEACEGGEPAGCYELAQMYEQGTGVSLDVERAAVLYQRSCEDGGMGCPTESIGGGPPPAIQDLPVRHTPYTDAPYVLNRDEVDAAVAREYPERLRRAGVGGTVFVHFYVDVEGVVQDARIDQSSGNEELDEAALRVARTYRFGPAYYRVNKVAVWISLPISFG